MKQQDAAKELTRETTLFDIWKSSGRIKPVGRNRLLRAIGLIGCAGYALLPTATDVALVDAARALASSAFPTILSLLGFLLAGLTIFVSVARRELLHQMAVVVEKDSGLPWLKVNLLSFVRPLIELLVIAAVLLAAILVAQKSGPFVQLVAKDESGNAGWWTARVGFVGVTFCVWCSLVAVKSAIRNSYHLIMVSLRSELEASPDDTTE